jgi:predicted amidophosphoribosyltransferase
MAVSAPCRFLPVRWLAEARDALAGILIPAPCQLCEKLLTHSSRIPVCERCLDGSPRLPEKICVSCGIPLPTWSRFRENMCSAQRAESERTRSIARGALRSMDVVVPVPLHRDREKERRYNQAELLSRPLAKLLRLPHRGVLLVRKWPRPTKHLLTRCER